MKESDEILLNHLLSSIGHELSIAMARSQELKPNTAEFNALKAKVSRWQMMLENMSRKVFSHDALLSMRTVNLKSLSKEFRYQEQQSILSGGRQSELIKQKITEIERKLAQLVYMVRTPGDLEVMANTLDHLSSLQNWHTKLKQWEYESLSSGDAQATELVREVSQLFRQNTSYKASTPVSGMIIAVIAFLCVVQSIFNKKSNQ